MTIITRPKVPAAPEPQRRVRKPPGRVRRAADRKATRTMREGAPYAVSLAAAAAAAAVLHQPDIAVLGLGGVGGVAGVRLHEARGWHRSGGKAAMRGRRRYQGLATRKELRANLSPAVVARDASVTCPGIDPSRVPVGLGRALGQDLAGSREDTYLLVAPPRSGKTGLMACWVADAPGSVLATSTRTDMYAHTAAARRGAEIWVLNPDGDGDIPSTLRWSPVDGCDDPATAIQRAGYLMDAAPRDKSGKDAWWDAKGAELLRLMLHAAAIAGASMHQVRAWIADPGHPDPAAILASEYAAPGWGHKLAALAASDEQLNGIIASAAAALAWMDDPAMAEAACPRPDAGFDAETFLECGHGTVYLIGADRPHGALAPYFASFAAHLFETAKRIASRSPGGRLPAPLTLALDEAAITCPVPLHKWLAEAGGHGITVMAAVQGISQLLSRWGDHDGRTIKKLSTIKLFWGGDTDAADLEEISAVCGMRDTWDHTRNPDGSKTKTPRQERAVPPERIRKLGPGEVLVLHRSTRPVIAKVAHVWDRRGYQRAGVAGGVPARDAAPGQAAIEAPRREAIPVPPAAPAGIGRREPAPALDSPSGAYAVPSYPPADLEEVTWHNDRTATGA